MRMRLLAICLVVAVPVAHAGDTLELAAGVDSSEGAQATGSASIERSGAARSCDPVCVLASDAPDVVRGELAATLAQSSYGDARVTGRFHGWQLAVGETVQPLGSLRDAFWRSGRGVDRTDLAVNMPGMVTIEGVQLVPASSTVDIGAGEADDQLEAAFLAAKHWSLFHMSAIERDRGSDTASQLSVDFIAIDADLDGTRVRANAGIDGTTGFGAPAASDIESPRYWLELSRHVGDVSASVGAGSWARLDPSGEAVDTGQLATGSLAYEHGRLSARASVEGGRLVRRFGAPLPPRAMGRAELEADVALAHSVAMIGTAWLERSDRDDPRWAVATPPTGAVLDHAGVGIGARWQIKNVVPGAHATP